jgi:hypothetical protein
MTLEASVDYLDDLDSAAPAAGDVISQADDHMRYIKKALKQTFPGAGGSGFARALVANEDDIDLLAGMVTYGLVAADMQKLADITATAAELNTLDRSVVDGTVEESKALVADASGHIRFYTNAANKNIEFHSTNADTYIYQNTIGDFYIRDNQNSRTIIQYDYSANTTNLGINTNFSSTASFQGVATHNTYISMTSTTADGSIRFQGASNHMAVYMLDDLNANAGDFYIRDQQANRTIFHYDKSLNEVYHRRVSKFAENVHHEGVVYHTSNVVMDTSSSQERQIRFDNGTELTYFYGNDDGVGLYDAPGTGNAIVWEYDYSDNHFLVNKAAVFNSTAEFNSTAQFDGAVTFTDRITTTDVAPATPTANSIYEENIVAFWMTITSSGGTPSNSDDFNGGATVTDNGVGDYTATIVTDMASTVYPAIATIFDTFGGSYNASIDTRAVGSVQVTMFTLAGAPIDIGVSVVIPGGGQ